MRVGVIGSGIGGMATGIRLALKGYEVEIFESNKYPGGKLSDFNISGFRFDAGPSLFTMPQYFEELFALAGKKFSDYCPYEKLTINANYFYSDGTHFKAFSDKYKFISEAAKCWGIDSKKIESQLKNSEYIYNKTSNIFLNQSLNKWSHYNWCDLFNASVGFPKLGIFNTMHNYNQKNLGQKHAIQYFNRFATYNGSNPYLAPATLNIIPYLEHGIGSFFPKGGMINITNALFQLAQELGIVFRFEERVNSIDLQKKKIIGVTTSKQFYPFDKIVSNMDIYFTYNKLLPSIKKPLRILNQERSSSALIFYWGINKTFEQLDLHNIFFSEDYKEEFDYIFNKKSISDDPTIYINISSKFKKDDAPLGCENWFVMVNAPNNSGEDWVKIIAETKEHILIKLEKILGEQIRENIVCEEILDPILIESKTSSYKGSLYGSSSNNKFAAFLRHKNFSSKVKDLYFCGGSVHPGGGIPLCMQSAKIVSSLIPNRQLKK